MKNTIIHKEFCPITLSLKGQWAASVEPYCNCEGFTHSGGSNKPEETKKTISGYKKFRCRGCYGEIICSLDFAGTPSCMNCNNPNSTGTIVDLIDVVLPPRV